MEEMNSKLVFSPQISRRLLKMGNQMQGIVYSYTVFVFKKDEKFNDDFNTVLNDIADEKQKRKSKTKKEEA